MIGHQICPVWGRVGSAGSRFGTVQRVRRRVEGSSEGSEGVTSLGSDEGSEDSGSEETGSSITGSS